MQHEGRKGRKGRVFRHSTMQIKESSVFKTVIGISFLDIKESRKTRPLRPSRPFLTGLFPVEGGK